MITIVELARQCECDHNTIRKWVKKNHIEVCKKLTGNRKYGDALSQTNADRFCQYWKEINTIPAHIIKLPDLARECNVDRKTIRLWAERNGIKLAILPNSSGPPTHGIDKDAADKFKQEYLNNKPLVLISSLLKEFNTDWRVIHRWAKKNNVEIHKMKQTSRRLRTALLTSDADNCRKHLRDMKAKGYFYFIQLIPKHDPNRIKMGFAYDVDKRLDNHRITCPELVLMGKWKCRRDLEKSTIKQLTSEGCQRLTSEVFDCDDYKLLLKKTEELFH